MFATIYPNKGLLVLKITLPRSHNTYSCVFGLAWAQLSQIPSHDVVKQKLNKIATKLGFILYVPSFEEALLIKQ